MKHNQPRNFSKLEERWRDYLGSCVTPDLIELLSSEDFAFFRQRINVHSLINNVADQLRILVEDAGVLLNLCDGCGQHFAMELQDCEHCEFEFCPECLPDAHHSCTGL